MLSAEDNDLLTQTDAGTPMGAYFRRFWQPAALSEELAEPDGSPVRVTIMGEELVAFRDTEGRIGLLDRRCPHRGADLFFGRNEECGLRCVYHGWKFDASGKAVDLPNVEPGVPLHDNVRVTSYPTCEYGEIVWAWLGPPEDIPEMPKLEFGLMPPERRFVTKQLAECNWAQVIEGDLDACHFSFLHMPAPSVTSPDNPYAPADIQRLQVIRKNPIPKIHILDHDTGFVIGWARDAEEEGTYWRTTQFMLPAHGTGPSALPGETYFGFTVAPITDRACWIFAYAWNTERDIGPEERAKLDKGHAIIAERGPGYVPVRNRSNDFQIDRIVQKNQTFTGVKGLAEQDLMVQQSQGFIADRTAENLTATDAAVVKFRRTLVDAARALAEGQDPAAPRLADAYHRRPGSHYAADGLPLEEVLVERFGHPRGQMFAPD